MHGERHPLAEGAPMSSPRRRLAVLVVAVVAGGLALAPPASAHPGSADRSAPDRVVTAYFADWDVYGRGYHVKDIPADQLNVIQYAFGVPTFDPATGASSCGVLDPWADYQ